MSYYSIWATAVLLIALLSLVATPLFKAADSPPIPATSRVATLDGLRGFLALAVFFTHGAIYHRYLENHQWRAPPDRFHMVLGQFGVALFFMITGFLFWSQIIDQRGRPDWLKLYIGRLFRIGPLYLAAVGVMVACVFAQTGWRPRVGPATLALQLGQWAALGLWPPGPLNGVAQPWLVMAGVTWTLQWEWFFYASLIVTSIFARDRRAAWGLALAGLCGSLALLLRSPPTWGLPTPSAIVALFCVGMLTATAKRVGSKIKSFPALSSTAALALMLTVLAQCWTAFEVFPILVLGGAFLLIANGASLFGLLRTQAARRLGNISFGIYLLQGLVLAAVFAVPGARRLALSSPAGHWTLVALAAVLLVIVATAAHALIERPGIDLGRRLARRTSPKR